MIAPVSLRVDYESEAAYVKYRPGTSVETVDLLPDGAVAYDRDAQGAILGIEILAIHDRECLTAARDFAHAHDLAFPRDISGIGPKGDS
jgi:uncharacterized protein YuzE